jgi:hypothetical protein
MFELLVFCQCEGCCDGEMGPAVGTGALIGAVAGAGIGALIGSSHTHMAWEPANLPFTINVIADGKGRTGLQLRLAF